MGSVKKAAGNVLGTVTGGLKSATGTGKRSMGGVTLDRGPFDVNVSEGRQQLEIRKLQKEQRKRLQDQAEGKSPSLAEAQLRQAQDRSLKQQLAAAAAQRGGNQASLQRALARSQAQQAQELASQATTARLQEQQQAEQALAQQLAQQRATEIGISESDRAAEIQRALAQSQLDLGVGQANLGAATTADQGRAGIFQSFAGGAGSGAAALLSDENEKEKVKKGDKKAKEMLDKLSAKEFEYKDDGSDTKRLGIMAQDLEKSSLGKALVKEVGGKKMIDIPQGFGAVLAAQSEMNDRLKAMESKLKKKNKRS